MELKVALEQQDTASRQVIGDADVLASLLKPENRQARLTEAMAQAGFLAGGQFQYAPPPAKDSALRQIQQADDEVLGRLFADVQDGVRLLSELMPKVEAELQEAPTAAAAITAIQRMSAIAEGPLTAELLEATLERDIPVRVAAMTLADADMTYRAAIRQPLKPTHAALIRAIEARVMGGVFPPFRDEAGAADRLADLARLVKTTREGRVPEAAKAWRAAVQRGSRAMAMAKAANLKPAPSVEQQHLKDLIKAVNG